MRFLVMILLMGLVLNVAAQPPGKVTLEGLEERARLNPDTLYVYNLWATWCRPCVAELPYFDAMSRELSERPVQVVLVSIDLPSEYAVRLPQFLRKRDFDAEVLWLDEPKIQQKIDAVSPEWTGAIPATLFLRGRDGLRVFHEGDFSLEQLRTTLNAMNP